MDDRHPDSLTDTAIDREIRTVLDVEPSPEFLARVRTRIANEPVAPSFGWSWVFAAAVAAVVVLAVMVSVSTREEMTADLAVGPTDTATVAPAVVPTFPPSRTFGDVSPKFAGSERPTADRSARAKESAVPEVLIAPDAVLAFQQFVAGVEERRFEISFDEPLPVAPTPQFTELTISPITIEPLEPIAVDEGVLQ